MSSHAPQNLTSDQRIVITGIGLTAPNGNNLAEYRAALLAGKSGVSDYDIRYVGQTLAGVCTFDALRYQSKKDLRRGTRAGSVGIYSTNESVKDAGLDWPAIEKRRVGVYLGVTEHGNVETENEIYALKGYDYDTTYWSHHHNPRTVANNPAGEVALNLGITGPHYTIGGGRCAAGNAGLIQGAQMLRLGDCDVALAGGVSESIHTFGIFASFKSQARWRLIPIRPRPPAPSTSPAAASSSPKGAAFSFSKGSATPARSSAKIYGELAGYAINTDATDFVLPNPERQAECVALALQRAGLEPQDIDIVSTHATGTGQGDAQECQALRQVFASSNKTCFNNTKSFIGHAMGAAGALELAGNLPAFEDNVCHATINVDELDPECALTTLVIGEPRRLKRCEYILNNSFGMLGINSVVIIKKFKES